MATEARTEEIAEGPKLPEVLSKWWALNEPMVYDMEGHGGPTNGRKMPKIEYKVGP